MKDLKFHEYEVIARRRVRLADGAFGWTGIMRAAYSIDYTVVGVGTDSIRVPEVHRQGAAGGSGERAYAKLITAQQIRAQSGENK